MVGVEESKGKSVVVWKGFRERGKVLQVRPLTRPLPFFRLLSLQPPEPLSLRAHLQEGVVVVEECNQADGHGQVEHAPWPDCLGELVCPGGVQVASDGGGGGHER